MSEVTHHPSGVQVEIVGIEECNRERSCEQHTCCGKVIALDTVLRLRKVQILNDQQREETAVAAYWVTDGIDRCRVGFLPRHCVRQAHVYDGHLVQVVAMLAQSENASERKKSRYNRGACYASIIDTKVTKVVSAWNERTRTASMHDLASSILAGGGSGSDAEDDDEICEYVDDDQRVEGKQDDE